MKHTYNAHTTQSGRQVLAEELLFVLEGWLGEDDWGVETYPYPETVRNILTCLKAGDNPRALRLIGKNTRFRAVLAHHAPVWFGIHR